MAKHYPFVDDLASRLDAARAKRGLSYGRLGEMAEVDTAHVWRICRGEFATLSSSVLKICNELDVKPQGKVPTNASALDGTEARLAAEVIAAWDRTEAGAQLLTRVLRALRHA